MTLNSAHVDPPFDAASEHPVLTGRGTQIGHSGAVGTRVGRTYVSLTG